MIIVKKQNIIDSYKAICKDKKDNYISLHLKRNNFDFANSDIDYNQAEISDLFTISLLKAKFISFNDYLKACNKDKKQLEKLLAYCLEYNVTMKNKDTIQDVIARYKRHIINDTYKRLNYRLNKLSKKYNIDISNIM